MFYLDPVVGRRVVVVTDMNILAEAAVHLSFIGYIVKHNFFTGGEATGLQFTFFSTITIIIIFSFGRL